MAFTNTPSNDTYRTVRIEFDGMPTYRSGSLTTQRDCNIVNLFYDRISQENKTREVFLKKRPGLVASGYNLTKDTSSDQLRGYYYDAASNAFYWAVNDNVYRVAPDTSTTVRTVATLATSSGYVGFSDFLQGTTNTRYVIFSDGADLWVDDFANGTPACAKVTDVDMPTPHVPQPVSLDGYVFLADLNTGDIYNSANDDPTTWEAEYINAEMVGDYVTMLAVNRNYLVAFGQSSLEMFWDAGNASGSPLSRNDSGFRNIGYITGLCQISNILYFVGQDQNKNVALYALDGFNLSQISDEIVNRSLQTITVSNNVKGQTYLNRPGYSISSDGHTFYCIVTPQTTWLYDVEEKKWYEWKGSDGTGLKIEGSWPMINGSQYVAVGGQTYISHMSPTLYQDFGTDFTCSYTTERIMEGSYNWKICNKMTVIGDQHSNSGSSTLDISWSDDDWASASTTRTVNLFRPAAKIYRLGRFRTRSFRLSYSDNYPLRLRGLELELNIGTH